MKRLPKDKSKITRKILLALPSRKWDQVSEYDHLYIVPARKKHDSGYMLIAIIGETEEGAEIAAYCADICWTMPKEHPYGYMTLGRLRMILRTDCLYPAGILRLWGSSEHYFKGRFRVGCSLSSTNIELFIEPTDQVNTVTGKTVTKLPAEIL